jgi:hypothetical protein
MRPPEVQVVADEETTDVRAWAQLYARFLLELEDVAPISPSLPHAS